LEEIDRISDETQFNGKYVLGEDGGELTIQVGANDNETITINLERIDTDVLELEEFSVANGINASDVASDPISIDDTDNTGTLQIDDSSVEVTYAGSGDIYAYEGTEAGAPAYVIGLSDGNGETVYHELKIDDDGVVTAGSELA